MAAPSEYRTKAIEAVREATRLDRAGEYAEALACYKHALSHFQLYLKWEKNDNLRQSVRARVDTYLSRAEVLKAFLDDAERHAAAGGGGGGAGDADADTEVEEERELGKRRRTAEELEAWLGGRSLEDALHENVIGQTLAVRGLARAVMREYLGWRMGDSPMVFMFVGSSGVGKTELAKSLALALLGDANAVVRIDMGEFSEKHSVARLLGAPQGYVGSQDSTYFADALRENPSAVVLLDEIEKAHVDLITILLALFDEGRFTPAKGETIHCREAVFIMTSNLGADLLGQETVIATDDSATAQRQLVQLVEPALKAHFRRDEFLGRIDDILPFLPFTGTQLEQIVRLFLGKWTRLASSRHGITLTFSEELVATVVERYNPRYGVRSIKSAVERRIGNALADASADGVLQRGCTAVVDVDADGQVCIQVGEVVGEVDRQGKAPDGVPTPL